MDRKRVFIRSEDAGCAAGQAARPAWRDSLLANSGASGETGAALAVGRLHQAGARGWLAGGLKGLGNLLHGIVQAVNARSVERSCYGIPQTLFSRLHILSRHGHRLVPHKRLDAVQRHSAVSQLRAKGVPQAMLQTVFPSLL